MQIDGVLCFAFYDFIYGEVDYRDEPRQQEDQS